MPATDLSVAVPVACTLNAVDMGSRLARIRQLTRTHLQSHDLQGSTLRLTYGPDAAAELSAIVDLERGCCGFLNFELNKGHDVLELRINAPQQAGTDAQWLFSKFLPEPQATGCDCDKG